MPAAAPMVKLIQKSMLFMIRGLHRVHPRVPAREDAHIMQDGVHDERQHDGDAGADDRPEGHDHPEEHESQIDRHPGRRGGQELLRRRWWNHTRATE